MAKGKRKKLQKRRALRVREDHLKALDAIARRLVEKGHPPLESQAMVDRAIERYIWIAEMEANGYALSRAVRAPTPLKLS